MLKQLFSASVFAFALMMNVTVADEAQKPSATLEENFQAAPMILPGDKISLKPLPLWHTNGILTEELIDEFFEKGTENGFGGFTFLPLGRTQPKYLSEEYFRLFGKVLESAKARGEKIVF